MKHKTPLLLLVAAGVITFAFVAPVAYALMTTHSIPGPLISYAAQHSGSYGCVSGTLNPLTITSTSCPTGPNLVINGGPT